MKKQEIKPVKVVKDAHAFNKKRPVDASKSSSSIEKSFQGNDGK